MADRKQRLINFHTSGVTNMPLAKDVHLGEIVVRHADEKPELLIKQTNGEFAVIPASGAVASAIASAIQVSESSIDGKISQVEGSLSGHVEAFEQYKIDAAAEFATKEEVSGHVATLNSNINAAKAEVYNSATTFATSAVGAAKTELQGDIADLRSEINKANSSSTEFEEFVEANYATSANTVAAIDAAKDAAIGSASAYTDAEVAKAKEEAIGAASAYTNAEILKVNGSVDTVSSSLDTLSGVVDSFSASVIATYAKSADTVNAIAVAKDEAIGAASAYTKAREEAVYASATSFATNAVSVAQTTLQGNIDAVAGDVADNTKAIEDAATHLAETYATSANTVAAIDAAKDAAIGAASAYTDAEVAEAKAAAIATASAYTDGKISEVRGEIESLESGMESGFTAIRTDLSATTEDLTELINNKVAVAYRYAGSCLYAELPASGDVIGEVWNVTDANGNFPAGTNYAWDGEKWDALGGSVDLSPYAKVADFEDYKEEVSGEFEDVRSEIADANSGVSILSANVVATYATSADTVSAIAKAQKAATDASSAYTDTREAAVYASATSFATSAVNAAKTELQGEIADVDAKVDALSGSVVNVKAVADSAVQNASIVDGETCKVSVEKVGTELQFDFSNLVIDCGEF